MRRLVNDFFAWFERHYAFNVGFAAGLFLLQLVHLYWLATDVVARRLTGESWFSPGDLSRFVILVVDYTEIPALVGVSLVYLNDLRKGWNWRSALFLLFLNSQWLHIFWITDEFVVNEVGGSGGSSLPGWLVWVAIGIDYLELPVIGDTLHKFVVSVREQRLGAFLREDLR
jgi:hypothetical protein